MHRNTTAISYFCKTNRKQHQPAAAIVDVGDRQLKTSNRWWGERGAWTGRGGEGGGGWSLVPNEGNPSVMAAGEI